MFGRHVSEAARGVAVHGIENASDGLLAYASTAVPASDVEAAYDGGQLREGRT